MSTELVKFNVTDAALAELGEKYKGVRFDVQTKDGMKAAIAGRAELRTIRVDIEKTRVELKAPLLETGRLIDAEAKRITVQLSALEDPIDKQIKAEEKRFEEEKRAAERAEAERIAREERELMEAEKKRVADERAELDRQRAALEEQQRAAAERDRKAREALETQERETRARLQAEEDRLAAERTRLAALAPRPAPPVRATTTFRAVPLEPARALNGTPVAGAVVHEPHGGFGAGVDQDEPFANDHLVGEPELSGNDVADDADDIHAGRAMLTDFVRTYGHVVEFAPVLRAIGQYVDGLRG